MGVKRICIDPGHGGRDPGAHVISLSEKDFTLIVCSMVAVQLSQMEFEVTLTRFDDSYIGLRNRCQIANEFDADLFVSIHANAAMTVRAKGFEAHYISDAGKSYARKILQNIMRVFPEKINRGVKQSNFTVLKYTKMPAVLIECGFMTNTGNLFMIKDERAEVMVATAICNGIKEAFNGGDIT